jgi:hypothetical protein
MTHFIAHRVNTVQELKELPLEYGVEIDLRDFGSDLILQHDPFKTGELFEEYLAHYQHGTMILNIKSERIEFKILELLEQYKITDYFFLDSSFPMIYLLSNNGESRCAVRYSEYEGLDTVLSLAGKIDWVWVDCFSKLPLDIKIYQILKNAGFKLCLVSPELQGRQTELIECKNYLNRENIIFDAICTKHYNIEAWK